MDMAQGGVKVSVIIPAFNEERYLARCLETVVNQTLKEIEIIVIDDGSTDHTYQICDEFSHNYPDKVIVIHKQNEGVGPARNSGLAIARGKYIGFVDADDWVDDTMYEEMLKSAETYHSDMVVCDVRKIFVSENREAVEISLPDQDGIIDIGAYIKDGRNPAYSWNKLYKKEIWETYQFRGGVYEDLELILIILTNCNVISYVQKPFNTYYKRENSITTSYRNIRLLDIMKAYEGAAYGANEKYKKETVFCVAKRILINLDTPGLILYKADFIELINRLMPLFEENEFIKQDREIVRIFSYKNKRTIPKVIFCIGKEMTSDFVDSVHKFVRGFDLHYLYSDREEKRKQNVYDVLRSLDQEGGIYANHEMKFPIPIGELRSVSGFIVFNGNGQLIMFGTVAGNWLVKEITKLCETLSLEQGMEKIVLDGGKGMVSKHYDDNRVYLFD